MITFLYDLLSHILVNHVVCVLFFSFLFKVVFCSSIGLQVVPCALLALAIHPSTSHHFVNRIFWAFCVYLEAVSVLPQLRVMQNTKVASNGLKDIIMAIFSFLFSFFLGESKNVSL